MSNYSDNPGHVRVDRFKAGGKWYDTFVVDMSKVYDHGPTVYTALGKAMRESTNEHVAAIGKRIIGDGPDPQLTGSMFIVCLEPYHTNGYPISMWLV